MWRAQPRISIGISLRLPIRHLPCRRSLPGSDQPAQRRTFAGVYYSAQSRLLSIALSSGYGNSVCSTSPIQRTTNAGSCLERGPMPTRAGPRRCRRRLSSTTSSNRSDGVSTSPSVTAVANKKRSFTGDRTPDDGPQLLRRVATYIEEDPGAAEALGKAIGSGTRTRLSAALGGMHFGVRQPSWKELRRVAFISAVPFVGFGMMDNVVMIVAGEYIDITLGVAVGISTMAAAGLGNTISDLAGVGLGGFVESVATKMGLPPNNLSRAQMLLRSTRTASLLGSALGVTVGCLIGMFPLLFLPDAQVVEAVKRREKLEGLVDAVVVEVAAYLSATSATLYILDRESQTLWARRRGQPGTPAEGAVQDLRLRLADRGPVSGAARTGEAVHVRAAPGGASPSMLCMPVLSADGLVAGVVQLVGKRPEDPEGAESGFTAEDAKDLSALCSHISVALENIKRTNNTDEVDLRETISLMRSYGGVNHQHRFPQHRLSTQDRSVSVRSLESASGFPASRAGDDAKT